MEVENETVPVEKLKAQQEEIKFALKDMMKSEGATSLRTLHGTATLVQKTKYSTHDWDSFKNFILEHQAVDLLEKRIAQSNMAMFLSENPGAVPPGLNSITEDEIRITKPAN